MTDSLAPVTAPDTTELVLCRQAIEAELARGAHSAIVRMLELLFELALHLRASDVHLSPGVQGITIRMRIDGELQDTYILPQGCAGELIARLKILAGLRTDEHFAAQDGRFQIPKIGVDGGTVDMRLSIVPVYYGENAVVRLLCGGTESFTFSTLGFSVENQVAVAQALAKPYGMILVTGPTGSGKTTTLYTLLQQLDATKTAIMTIEDPIEYAIAGVNQIQVQPRTGLTFATGLRSILRQDPNTIMVGEIRDGETAGLAVNISLTGHLVLSTLHTNDAATTLPRLLDMKIEPYLIASTVNVAIGQRLVRRLCERCKVAYTIAPLVRTQVAEFAGTDIMLGDALIYRSGGCAYCNQTGYQGRVGIHEVMVMSEGLRTLVLERAPAKVLRATAISEGMVPLVHDGFVKVRSGQTSIEEIFKLHHE